ncbi:hypothetical protein EhV378 [Emiliania huxleyi virus 86]|uniref:Uncharacterized protein n=1 Tax=Emiliania huxleyi virus 86 (isolate United Kingdom/English Channel/1999) TaxID=654925 RepID=Q4A2A1_EHV8U|nr:hypothetical protein EhV378 [Emiliania huxleyi virus 86]AEO97914.1 hypothetical protein ENVG_00016 [Emiliania huxleyi virus 84]AEP15168.1 hypothetical protein EOVG_00231 [Emiliania huxleyi virus 88]AHA54990.1 hypothetical protein EhV145_00441 [Emiliania huxleyi virus 145]AHA56001.1 hypothetical protein EhV164_00414 [Emiliania huxleyi virus 164]CAI65805.1 hypothetical protein EhV378 [Emiliania huxleyi virus 86]
MSKTLDAIHMSDNRAVFKTNALIVKVFPKNDSGKGSRSFMVIDDTTKETPITVKAWGDAANQPLIEAGKCVLIPGSVNEWNGRKSLNLNFAMKLADSSIAVRLNTLWENVKDKYSAADPVVKTISTLSDANTSENGTVVKDLYAVVRDVYPLAFSKNDKPMRSLSLRDNEVEQFYIKVFGDDAAKEIEVGTLIKISFGRVNIFNENRSLNVNTMPMQVETTPNVDFNEWYSKNSVFFIPSQTRLSVHDALNYDMQKNPVVAMKHIVVDTIEDGKSVDRNNNWKRSFTAVDKSVTESHINITMCGENAETVLEEGDVVSIKRVKLSTYNDKVTGWINNEPPIVVNDEELHEWWHTTKSTTKPKTITSHGLNVTVDRIHSMTPGCRVHLMNVSVGKMGKKHIIVGDTRNVQLKLPDDVPEFTQVNAEIRSAIVGNGEITVTNVDDFIIM